ncbi:phage baseplate assembly protein V [Aquabacterium sp. OR-4]|uniref:phage baseplate assembly protein V n=1 Tax=Aquabacterium sp. OR-4 TaxID=2978127 RepID=UPI0021B27218|nr:phage baseplate assembly protein V [Aquabacterium sp. OR-4]MDT7836290.1 phage baseplate assembly protein V [Aquabacterium sp. OR-4]
MSVVDVQILSEGQAVDPSISLLSVDVRRELNRLPSAQLLFIDGDPPAGTFPISDSAVFAVGKQVEITAGYTDDPSTKVTLFRGPVVRHAVEANPQGGTLRIELRDMAHQLTQGRHTALFEKQADSAVFSKLVRAASLKTGRVDATAYQHPALVQFDCTDWDFLVTRAEANGCVVLAHDGQLSWRKLEAPARADFALRLGLDLVVDFSLEIDGLAASSRVSATGWDLPGGKLASAQGRSPPTLAPGDSRSASLARALSGPPQTLAALAPAHSDELAAWADAVLTRAELAAVRGRVTVQGLPKAALLAGMSLEGMGQRFAGTVPITGLAHRIANGLWLTDLQLGLPAKPHHRAEGLASPAAAGLNPPDTGLSLGVVTQVHGDPDGQFRVQVKLLGTDDPPVTLWARVAAPVAGKERGWQLRPAVNDQVVLACLHGDPRQPVVLGSLHGPGHEPPKAVLDDSADDSLSGFATRSGLQLVLDDKKKSLLLKTPAGHQVLLDDDAKAITLEDSHGNQIVLDQDGVRIKSVKDLSLEASGNVTVKGAKIDLK